MNKQEFSERLSSLRISKGVSARDMSLSIGQSAGYINNIENGKNLPSMSMFFEICEYLDLSPSEFFNYTMLRDTNEHKMLAAFEHLDPEEQKLITSITEKLSRK